MTGGNLAGLWATATLILLPTIATGQTVKQAEAPTQPSAAQTAQVLGDTPRAPTEPWQPFKSDGIALTLTYTGEAAANPTGGIRQGSAYAGQVFAGLDADLDRIAGIDGATIHVAVTNRHGKSLSQIAIGNNTSVQETYGTQDTHLALLTWQQRLFDGRFEFEAGRSVSNVAFTTSPLYCAFQSNAVCGNPVFVYFAGNSSGFPASRWAAHATVRPADNIYVHVGAYEVNPDRGAPGDHGLRFDLDNATGAYLPFEIGYQTKSRLPGQYQFGGWFDRSSYDDPLRDADGQVAITSGRPAARRFGRTGLYVRFDQRLTRNAVNPLRGLSVFGVAMASVAGRVPSNRFLELGALQTGTFPGRDTDTIGLVVTDQRLSDLALQRLAIARSVAGGGTTSVARHQIIMEANYGMQLGRGLRVMPNVQYIVNPDQIAAPFQRKPSGDALVLGFRLTIDALALIPTQNR